MKALALILLSKLEVSKFCADVKTFLSLLEELEYVTDSNWCGAAA
jgi:hypothetical protein